MSNENTATQNGTSTNGNGHAEKPANRISKVEKQAKKAAADAAKARALLSKERMPEGLSIGQQALWLSSRSGKSKPSVKYNKPKTDDKGFVTSPALSIRAPGKFDAESISVVCETMAEKSVGGLSTKEGDADEGWVHSEGNVRGKDMANAIRLLKAHQLVK